MITKNLKLAQQKLQSHDVVVIPTETVYGLAASIDSPRALKKIFKIKKRPFFDPLIVHVSDQSEAQKLVSEWPIICKALVSKFWPGPLTLVLPKSALINPLITAGLDTVGIRCPNHPMTLKLLRQCKTPLAAPSANLFGKTSPTRAMHVEKEFKKNNLLILDGGPCKVGIESTILQIRKIKKDFWELEILRPGMIQKPAIDKAIRKFKKNYRWKISKNDLLKSKRNSSKSILAPGMLQHHYMPNKPLIYFTYSKNSKRNFTQFEKSDLVKKHQSKILKYVLLNLPNQTVLASRELYQQLRNCADSNADFILFFEPANFKNPSWASIKERLTKAATQIF